MIMDLASSLASTVATNTDPTASLALNSTMNPDPAYSSASKTQQFTRTWIIAAGPPPRPLLSMTMNTYPADTLASNRAMNTEPAYS